MSKSPSLRRIQADVRELALDPSDRYHAAPLEDDMFEWHFTIRGADGTDFEGGIYHGRILLPPEYPFKPPHIVFLTPSGRFETGTKVCLSFSAYHPELWQPAWGIRLILEALISFLPTPADGAIGALDWTSAERKRLAKKSVSFCCQRCGKAASLLPEKSDEKNDGDGKGGKPRFAKEIEQLRLMQAANESKLKESELTNEQEEEHPREDTPALSEEQTSQTVEQTETTSPSAAVATEARAKEEETPMPTPATEQEQPVRQEEEVLPVIAAEQAVPLIPDTPPAAQLDRGDANISWLIDPMLQATIVLLAVICYLLSRKIMDLLEELKNLDAA